LASRRSIVTFFGLGMNLTLHEEDRQAVDLLLDGAAAIMGSGNGNQVVYAVTDASLGERVARTQKLVQLLDALPQDEPPADLLDRTLRLVEGTASHQHAAPGTLSDVLGAQRPIV
jgi:hypothetical protein